MIFYEEYGNPENPTIIFLHGATCPPTFCKLYGLAEKYHLVVPHIYGYGKEAAITYNTDAMVNAIKELVISFGDKKCVLVGFSLGAQLALVLESYYSELFCGGIFISAWVIKDEKSIKSLMRPNLAMLTTLKWHWYVKLQGKMLGLKGKELDEFVEYAPLTTKETMIATVDNGIDINNFADKFSAIPYKTIAICGIKEPASVKNSLYKITELNGRCDTDLWDRAAHNIPYVASERLYKTVDEYMEMILNGQN